MRMDDECTGSILHLSTENTEIVIFINMVNVIRYYYKSNYYFSSHREKCIGHIANNFNVEQKA